MTTVKTVLHPGDFIASAAVSSAALGSETSDRVDSIWFPASSAKALCTVSGIAEGDTVTLTMRQAHDVSGTAAADISTTNPAIYSATAATVVGTADPTAKFQLMVEVKGPLDAAFTHLGMRVSTSNATGAEVVAGSLLRWGNYFNTPSMNQPI